MTNILFICGKARMRSPTAAAVAQEQTGVSTDYAGLSNDADEMISIEQIEWADTVAVMERRQLSRLNAKFAKHLKSKRIICLNIPDDFEFMQSELILRLEKLIPRILQR